jgi:hypothetical protein
MLGYIRVFGVATRPKAQLLKRPYPTFIEAFALRSTCKPACSLIKKTKKAALAFEGA